MKDGYKEQHSDDIPIPNLEVMSLMKSFASKGFVKETFNWRWHYYYLTNDGIEYLRQYLALPADIVPATLKVTAVKTRPGKNICLYLYHHFRAIVTLTAVLASGEEQQGERKGKNFSGGDFKPEFRRDEYRK